MNLEGKELSVCDSLAIERRFSCVVCLSPKFRMIYGLCQHRICTSCAYELDRTLKPEFCRCPTCQQENVFPSVQPCIPEDNIAMQKILGIRVCSNKGCEQELWLWETDEHNLTCPYRHVSPKYRGRLSNVKESYSTLTPRSPSKKYQDSEDIDESNSYLLRSGKRSKQKTHSAPKYYLRDPHGRSSERRSRT